MSHLASSSDQIGKNHTTTLSALEITLPPELLNKTYFNDNYDE